MIADNQSDVVKVPYTLPAFEVENGVTSLIYEGAKFQLQIFGEHNLLNLEAARSICGALGISANDYYASMVTFKGAARRLELLGKNEVTNIYKDFAHSPSKLKATIQAVKAQFPHRKLIACMELHTFSSLNKDFLNEYAGCMAQADDAVVFIDAQTFAQKKMEPYDEAVVKNAFNQQNLMFFDNSQALTEYVMAQNLSSKNLLLMSSGNFGGINLNDLAFELLNK